MKCPKCDSTRLGVMDSVNNNDANETYRKRKCLECGKIFYTAEFEVEYGEMFANDWNKYHQSQRRLT